MKQIIFVALLALTACKQDEDEDPVKLKYANESALANPNYVGRTPDGQRVYHATVKVGNSGYEQEIFFIGAVVTTNTRETSGKSSRSKVTAVIRNSGVSQDVVILNGIEHDPREVEAALTRDEDARRREELKTKTE